MQARQVYLVSAFDLLALARAINEFLEALPHASQLGAEISITSTPFEGGVAVTALISWPVVEG